MASLLRALGALLLVLLAASAALVSVVVVGLRRKDPRVVAAVRRFTRDVGNPRMLRTAGTAGDRTHVIRHVGRSSGRPYRTPVTAMPVSGGHAIALPYGPGTDWVRNVLAAGTAVLEIDGEEIAVTAPAVVPAAELAGELPAGQQRGLRLVGVTECLRLQRAD